MATNSYRVAGDRDRRRTSPLVASLAAFIVAGCGAAGQAPQSTASPTARSSGPATVAPSPVPSVDESPASASPDSATPDGFALGDTTTTPRGSRMTVHSWDAHDRSTPPPSGSRWFAADIEFCLADTIRSQVPIAVIREEFELELANAATVEPESEPASDDEVFASPTLTLGAGECARGPVIFAVPDGETPAAVLLASPLGTRRWELN